MERGKKMGKFWYFNRVGTWQYGKVEAKWKVEQTSFIHGIGTQQIEGRQVAFVLWLFRFQFYNVMVLVGSFFWFMSFCALNDWRDIKPCSETNALMVFFPHRIFIHWCGIHILELRITRGRDSHGCIAPAALNSFFSKAWGRGGWI